MKHLSIIVPQGQNNLSSIVGPYKIFNRANEYFKQNGKREVFKVEVVGVCGCVDYYEGLFTVHPHKDIGEVGKTDLLIIPSLNHNYEAAIASNEILINWIKQKYKEGVEIASICTGSFLPAAAGILNGKSCSTHWAAADTFKRMFPKVNMKTDQIITDECGIYTNGGAYSFLNLMIFLIEKYYDRDTALFCSKVFQIDVNRNMQSEFSIFSGYKKHDDEVVKEAQIFLESNYGEYISIQRLSDRLNLSRRNFDRRFIKETGFTPLNYLQRVRVEAAKRMFESSRRNVNEVMYEVGYNDSKAFREVFSRVTGRTPVEYRQRANEF